jgi:hypothetical protein
MGDIAIFADGDSQICDFFEASRFLLFRKASDGWRVVREQRFAPITPASPAQTRAAVKRLLPLIAGSEIVAGGALFGIPYAVFDQAGLHIFEIGALSDEVLDEMVADVRGAERERVTDAALISGTRPVETRTPGFYELDLIEVQSKHPELSSKKLMKGFLEDTPFLELRLRCKHLPPWIENSGSYAIQTLSDSAGVVTAVISRNC